MVEAKIEPTFEAWRTAARAMLLSDTRPADIFWNDGSTATLPLFATSQLVSQTNVPTPLFTIPRGFLALAKTLAFHRDIERWPLLYRILHRLTHGEPELLEIVVDDDVYRLLEMEKSVRRDIHKMHAFVRFRKIEQNTGEVYAAFHRPDHLIVPAIGPWFARRFPVMRWTIFTPDASVIWNGTGLAYGPGVASSTADEDGVEDLWLTYYANIFNPARVKISIMKKEMPVRHWQTLPETRLIDELLRDAPARVEEMMKRTQALPASEYKNTAANAPSHTAAEFIPQTTRLSVLHTASQDCKGCDLYCHATQTVFGQGPTDAVAMFVGEQPGDQEDLAGQPFIGPAGQLLDEILQQVGINRLQCYVTNAVKHFKFEPRGQRRIHSKPNAREVNACRPWLEAEVALIKPRMMIALGATAAQSMMGPQFRVTASHGKVLENSRWAPWFMATIHPSALLRIPDPKLKAESRQQFIEDLMVASVAMRSRTR